MSTVLSEEEGNKGGRKEEKKESGREGEERGERREKEREGVREGVRKEGKRKGGKEVRGGGNPQFQIFPLFKFYYFLQCSVFSKSEFS